MVAALTCKTLGLDHGVQVEMAVPLHRIDQHWDQRLQAFAANPMGSLPQDSQRLTDRLVVQRVSGARRARSCHFLAQHPDRVFGW